MHRRRERPEAPDGDPGAEFRDALEAQHDAHHDHDQRDGQHRPGTGLAVRFAGSGHRLVIQSARSAPSPPRLPRTRGLGRKQGARDNQVLALEIAMDSRRKGLAPTLAAPGCPARRAELLFSVVLLGSVACARPGAVPETDSAVQQFAEAARDGNSDAIYDVLTQEAQRTYGRSGVRELVAESRQELRKRGEALLEGPRQVSQSARVRFDHGAVAEVALEHGQLKVASAGLLPARPRTAAEALEQLRGALERRSYPALMRVLSRETAATLDQDIAGIVDALESPTMLDIKESGEDAEVQLPGGHWVKLRREDGVWRVHDLR